MDEGVSRELMSDPGWYSRDLGGAMSGGRHFEMKLRLEWLLANGRRVELLGE